jgi:hypothetical protein
MAELLHTNDVGRVGNEGTPAARRIDGNISRTAACGKPGRALDP